MSFASKQKKPAIQQIVPEWYDLPRRNGADAQSLRSEVETFCRTAMASKGETGEPETEWVDAMIVMYEAAYSEGNT